LLRLSSIRSQADFQGSVAAVSDLALALCKSGVLLRISLKVETARWREIHPLEAIVERLTPTIANLSNSAHQRLIKESSAKTSDPGWAIYN